MSGWPIAFDDIRPGDTVERVYTRDGVTDIRRFTVKSRHPTKSTTGTPTTNLQPAGGSKRRFWDRPGSTWHLIERP